MNPVRLGRLRGGRPYTLMEPRLPWVRRYYVLCLSAEHGTPTQLEIDEFWSVGHGVARALAVRHHEDPECFSILFNGRGTRRKPWPHLHVVIAGSVQQKRHDFFFLALKHVLRPWRWPWLRPWLAPSLPKEVA